MIVRVSTSMANKWPSRCKSLREWCIWWSHDQSSLLIIDRWMDGQMESNHDVSNMHATYPSELNVTLHDVRFPHLSDKTELIQLHLNLDSGILAQRALQTGHEMRGWEDKRSFLWQLSVGWTQRDGSICNMSVRTVLLCLCRILSGELHPH